MIVGYNHSASDVSNIVLSTVALVAPPIAGIIKRVYPYANLSDLTFLETEGKNSVCNIVFYSKSQ